jgi:hypothetical protein
LIALLLPAVQAAREAARRSQCSNNMKQIVLGLHNYHDTFKTFPASSYCTNANGMSTIGHCHTWMETLLPFIEQGNVHDQIDFGVANNRPANAAALNGLVIDTLLCPSDPDRGLFPNSRETGYTPYETTLDATGGKSMGANYVGCAGPIWMNCAAVAPMTPNINCKADLTGAAAPTNVTCRWDWEGPGMFTGGRLAYGMDKCSDGTSNTFLIGEALPAYSSLHMYFASHMHVGSNNAPPNFHKTYTACPKSPGSRVDACYCYMGGFQSEHPGVVQMGFTDGSIHAISETIDYRTWCFLGDRQDKQPVGSF